MKELERDLGLPAVLAISIGAMVGSGIFILPGLALKMAGPAVILAYLLAGLLVLPAALSKSEMATAMPESGGTYLYIERGMGPLLGTIAGVGTWFSLTFKGALALIGGAPYLVLLFDLPVKPVALVAGFVLIVINIVGVKQTGRLQVAIVVVMLAALTWFVAGSATAIDPVSYGGFFDSGLNGLLAATGFVFVSYAGVTKVASVAEEIENPDRNIPLGILGSLAFTTALYVALVVVMVGVVPAADLMGSNIPMALAAEATLPGIGIFAVILAAVIALISTANAGILSSSRYPLAMSRDALAPPTFTRVSDRFGTPLNAITLTGAMLLFMVAFVPIQEIAKLASAFQILVFVLVNIALIAFREADPDSYEPSFRTPLYPVPQLFGIVGGIVLIPFMGLIPLVGAVLIVLGSMAWYYTYVRTQSEIEREGAVTDAVRQQLGKETLEHTEAMMTSPGSYDVLVAVTESTPVERERTLLAIAEAIASAQDSSIRATRFDEVPDQLPLGTASDRPISGDKSFEERMAEFASQTAVPMEYGTAASHDTKHAIVNHADHHDLDAILMERRGEQHHTSVFGSDVGWIKRHTERDVIEVEDRGLADIDRVSLVTDCGHGDATKLLIAEALAATYGADLELLAAVEPTATDPKRATTSEHLEEMASHVSVPVQTRLIEAEDRPAGLIEATRGTGLLVTCAGPTGLRGALLGRPEDRLIVGSDATAVAITTGGARPSRLRRFLGNRVF
ncbi:APC family permease [Halodesulfurarchaeum formicicum]|uniref:Amino acid permease-associated region n=1 Tax=Halodesulfurarchaeum formicicum TaxID=1873524 RepID=A0A1J1AAA4_9EURY|nr:amino acid permease [Halodesulfurarchaeum formicicum]APE94497.1 amino acid permease-associated region [Halodesulfurarchaeum formicicum]